MQILLHKYHVCLILIDFLKTLAVFFNHQNSGLHSHNNEKQNFVSGFKNKFSI